MKHFIFVLFFIFPTCHALLSSSATVASCICMGMVCRGVVCTVRETAAGRTRGPVLVEETVVTKMPVAFV